MRALILERPGPAERAPLQLRQVDDPHVGPGDLRLRVSACAVCRTDLQLATGEVPPHRRDAVLGHQAVGIVEEVGTGVSNWQVGERAGVGWLASVDGVCRFCRSGRENLCPEATFTAWDRDGGFAEQMTVQADFAFHLPDRFDDLQAAPLLCGGVIGYRALKRSGIEPGGRLGLFGFGASALQTIQVARYWGCRVFVTTRSERDRERARALGATWAGGYDDSVPEPLDAAVTFAPVGDVVIAALRAVDRGATVAINAIHLDHIPEFPYDLLWWERRLASVANYTRDDAREYLELAASIPVETTVDVFPLDQGSLALERLADGKIEGAAVLTPR
jgi:alcohol dehydrogenase, propanol-preferring